jgi:hypothetical protein
MKLIQGGCATAAPLDTRLLQRGGDMSLARLLARLLALSRRRPGLAFLLGFSLTNDW